MKFPFLVCHRFALMKESGKTAQTGLMLVFCFLCLCNTPLKYACQDRSLYTSHVITGLNYWQDSHNNVEISNEQLGWARFTKCVLTKFTNVEILFICV